MTAAIREAEPAEWDHIHGVCPFATFYQGRRWMEHLARFRSPRFLAKPERAGAWLFRFSDGLEGIIPYHRYCATQGLSRKYVSGGDALYGGWVGAVYPESQHKPALERFLRAKNVLVRESPFAAGVFSGMQLSRTAEFSAVLNLAAGAPAIEAAWRKRSPKILQYARKAAQSGVTVRRTDSLEEWREFARIHRLLLERRADATVYEVEFFASLHGLAAPELQLWVALRDGRVIAGQLAAVHRQHVALFAKGATTEAFSVKAPTLLDVTMIRAFAEAGLRWYDHDGCGSPDASIAEYKRRLGCEFLPSPILENECGVLRAVQSLRRKFGRMRSMDTTALQGSPPRSSP